MPYTLPKPHRQYLPQKFNPLNKKDLKEILDKLLNFPPTCFKTAKEWFALFHELSCAVSEAQTLLELNINLSNNDKSNEKKCEDFEKNILSELLSCREQMMEIYLNSPFKYSMHAYDNGRVEQDLLARKKFSVPQLSQLQIEENKIIREYKKFTNTATTQFSGKDVLLSVVLGKIHDADIKIRKDAFFTYWQFVKKNEEKFQNLFDQLLENRRAQTSCVGCNGYTEIAFAELGRFDYGPAECSSLRKAIQNKVVPTLIQLSQKQAVSLNQTSPLMPGSSLKAIQPWNRQVWPDLTPAMPPAGGSQEELLVKMQKIMSAVHPAFGRLFEDMRKRNLLDIFPRMNKSAGAFTVTLQESRLPFLFGNFGVNLRDTFILIHEFGHCLHSYAITNIDNILLRHPGFEFCELASIGLELLASKYLNKLWPKEEDAQNALRYQLFQILQFWPFMAMMDEWQHDIYSAKEFLHAKERNALWQKLSKKYQPYVDWNECQEFEELGWLSRPHIYTTPFYFIDYGIAQIGALQLWLLSKQNYPLAVEKYIRGLSLGAQLNLPALYQNIHAEFNFNFNFCEDLLEKLCLSIIKEILS